MKSKEGNDHKQSLKFYDHRKVEKKWKKRWLDEKLYTPDIKKTSKPFYNLWMFPYPSAEGLHAGHAFASTGSDVIGRFSRMQGWDIFQPMVGYDSFGIHAENYALKIKEHPMVMLKRVTKHYGEQMKTLGHGYDWTSSVTTSDIDYYKWTEWLFVQMFKAGLAYRKKATVNWCPSCKTVLADEQVMTPAQAGKEAKYADGKTVQNPEQLLVCERCGTVVEKKDLEQWFFRITDYADKLLANLSKINWPEKIKIAQTNWIGKKEGIEITYPVTSGMPNYPNPSNITVWTSRPDTNFGATFIVVAPEYAQENLLHLLDKSKKKEVENYIKKSLYKSKEDRIAEGRKKTGVSTGLFAINQLNDYKMPIYVADFVLSEVGTGAVVGVPGHDKRDFEFAKEFNLEVRRVVVGQNKDQSEITSITQVQEEEGTIVNSEFLDGLDISKATEKMMDYLEKKGWGVITTNYHLRDWLISRQRYWGTPIPMIYCQRCAKEKKGYLTPKCEVLRNKKLLHEDQSDWNSNGWWPEENLPIKLPFIPDYEPEGTGNGPLAKHPEFYKVVCPHCGLTARRETDVSDTFLDSSWYFLRYPTVNLKNSHKVPFDKTTTKTWLPVDLYFGGAEHSVLHLMYARFVTMVLNDLGYLEFDEPFPKFFAHGLMIKDGAKMSKSRGNVVNPDKYIEKYGADALRLYLMFMGPMDGYPDFRDTGIEGMRRFVDKVWQVFQNPHVKDQDDVIIKMHQTIKKVSEDIQNFKYNTAISAIMEFVNIIREKGASLESLKALVQLLAPFAPHIAEELWVNMLGQKFSVHKSSWPVFDNKMTIQDTFLIPVQVNGKLRATLKLSQENSHQQEVIMKVAKQNPKIKQWLEGKNIIKEIFVPGKILNIVTS